MKTKCSKSDKCNAPMCPLDKDIEFRIWFPDEPICNSICAKKLGWIKNQRKIKKRATDKGRYFILSMLKQPCIIRRGIQEIDPDKNESFQIEK